MTDDAQAAISALSRRFLSDHPGEAAQKLELYDSEEAAALLSLHPAAVVAPVLERMTLDRAAAVFELLSEDLALRVLRETTPNSLASLLAQQEEADRSRWLSRLGDALRKTIDTLLTYPDNTAGRLMDPRVHPFRDTMTVRQCLRRIRRLEHRPTRTLFLVDSENRLVAKLEMQDLVLDGPDTVLHALGHPIQVTVTPLTPREDVVELLETYKLSHLPVVDNDKRLIGQLHYEALVKAVEEEATADIQAMFGVSKDERVLSKPGFSVRKRLPWLQVNLLTAFLAAAGVGLFEDVIAQITALAVLLPVVAGQSGNAGAQALAVTMRGLALREITILQWKQVIRKEVMVGLANGLAVAATTCLAVFLWSRSPGITVVIGVSMILSMVTAGLAGASVPILLTRIGQDPATASSIILTTVTDVAGFFSFLGIATLLSGFL
ncbi:MAG: magnesium transporter [Nitrospinaceae bacterium]|nr:MAG: magnesium transporter [Nitrospinaceae bacterium]